MELSLNEIEGIIRLINTAYKDKDYVINELDRMLDNLMNIDDRLSDIEDRLSQIEDDIEDNVVDLPFK